MLMWNVCASWCVCVEVSRYCMFIYGVPFTALFLYGFIYYLETLVSRELGAGAGGVWHWVCRCLWPVACRRVGLCPDPCATMT